jgi:hypothetical protein
MFTEVPFYPAEKSTTVLLPWWFCSSVQDRPAIQEFLLKEHFHFAYIMDTRRVVPYIRRLP